MTWPTTAACEQGQDCHPLTLADSLPTFQHVFVGTGRTGNLLADDDPTFIGTFGHDPSTAISRAESRTVTHQLFPRGRT